MVTTARDASGPSEVLLAQRDVCAGDAASGPQLLLCCEGNASVGGHGTEFTGATIVREVDGPEAARAAVRRLVEIGGCGFANPENNIVAFRAIERFLARTFGAEVVLDGRS